MKSDPPQYVAPPPDPALAILAQQNEQQQTLAIQDRTSQATARLMQTYGTRLAMTGAQASPLIAAPVGASAQPRTRTYSQDVSGIM